MISRDDVIDLLSKCSAYDQRFPRTSDAVLAAWMEHFAEYPLLTRGFVLEAVKKHYKADDPKVPLPSHISRIARDLWADAYERESPDGPLHLEAEARRDALAAPDDAPALPAANVDREVVEDRRRRIAAFDFKRPRLRVEFCRFCGTRLESRSGLFVHPDGQALCPEAPVVAAESRPPGPEAPGEGVGAGEVS